MFFIHFLEHVLTLHPSFFGSHVKEYLTQKLLDDVEGICTGDYYIVCVMDTYDISEGRVIPGSGVAEYTIMYRAIVWKPFKGETVDAIVTSVKNQGIFAEVGPLTVFVSKHLIPPEIKWDPNATPPQYTDNADQVIEKGTNLRIKLIGLRNDDTIDIPAISYVRKGRVQNRASPFYHYPMNGTHQTFNFEIPEDLSKA